MLIALISYDFAVESFSINALYVGLTPTQACFSKFLRTSSSVEDLHWLVLLLRNISVLKVFTYVCLDIHHNYIKVQ